MEQVRKIGLPRPTGPVDLQLILNSTVNVKVKLQLVQKISDSLEECCRIQHYFDNMILTFLKLLSITEPAFSPDHDIFKLRKLILQIIHKICSSNDKIKNHIQSTMGACLKVIEIDNEQCVIYSLLIFKEILTAFKPKFDGCFKTEIIKLLKLIMDMYNNSNTQEKIFNFQKTSDLKVLISTIRLTTTITKNSVNYIFIPMGKVSIKVLKELANILKLYYVLFYGDQSFKDEIIEFFPILMSFFNLDLPIKPDYRDLVLDLKHAQVRLLFFFSIFLKDNKDAINLHCSTLPGRVIGLLNCNMSSDVSSLRSELLSGFESLILIEYRSEFLPHMDKFLDETLITGRSWSLKDVLRPKAYIYIDHLITHLHGQLSLNFLVCVIHLHFSNILDPTLQPEIQINLCNMVMNVLSYIVQRQNQLITNISAVEQNKNPIIDLFYRVFQVFVIKLKQFQKFYLPQLNESNMSDESITESISSILAENQSKEKQKEFIYGHHSSQIAPYTITDCKRFIKIIIPAVRTLFQFIVKTEGGKFSIELHYRKLFYNFIKHSLLSLKVCDCSIQKKEMVKEILCALSCINSIHLQTLITGDIIIKQIYANNLEIFIFELALSDEALVSTFSCLMFEFILNNLADINERHCVYDLVDRLEKYFKLNFRDYSIKIYIYKIIKRLMNNLQNTKHPIFFIGLLKSLLIIIESAKYELGEHLSSVLKCLFCDLLSYIKSIPDNLSITKIALAELCLAECMLKVIFHSQLMDLLSVVAYSLHISELTLQGLKVLEKCIVIDPNIFLNDSVLDIQNEIIKGLYHCLDSPSESISRPAVSLLGKFGGHNRSSIINAYNLNAQEQYPKVETPKIFISFEDYSDQLLEMDIAPGVNTAVKTIISNFDRFNRLHSWNVIKGFLMISMECDTNKIENFLSNNCLEIPTYTNTDKKLQYSKTIADETYIQALTGLMMCCCDEDLKADAFNYFNKIIKQFTNISICHFSGNRHYLKVKPYVLIDAIIEVISDEKETISNFGVSATETILTELIMFIADAAICFPFIGYMFKQFCELCYDASWTRKRGGCSGLLILFSNLLIEEETLENKFSNLIIQHFLNGFRAIMFILSDISTNLTFGTLDISQRILDCMFNWLYSTKSVETSYGVIKKNILKELVDNIFGSNNLLREQSIKLIKLIAEKQKETVRAVLKPYFKHFKSAIPGKQLFNTYTYKSQMGIMKSHIFCFLNSIPAKKLDFSKNRHEYYFNSLCAICEDNSEQIKKYKMFKCLTSNQLIEFRQTAVQVLANCLIISKQPKKKEIFGILLNAFKSPNLELQETVYQHLKSVNVNQFVPMKMVDKLFFYYAKIFKDYKKVTVNNTRSVLYLSKLFPSCPTKQFCTKLMRTFKYLWNGLHQHNKNNTSVYECEIILKNLLEIISLLSTIQFIHIQNICTIILNEDVLNIELYTRLYPFLVECLSKFPEDCVVLFLDKQKIKNLVWTSFFNSILRDGKCGSLRNVLTYQTSHLETLLSSGRNDPSRTIQYETIKIIYNLVQMDKKWITNSKKIISILLTIWSNHQYKERYKNLAAIKSTEWDEPKMLLKIILTYFKANINEVCILFQLLTVFSFRFPIDFNFFRRFLENDIITTFTIQWKRMVFYKFIELYQKKGVNSDILAKILHYLILPCFSMCYKNGEKEQLLCTVTKSDENIIGTVLNKIFNNIRAALTGCDYDGIKVSLCQLICLLIEDLLHFNENICDLIYNAVISCTWVRCTMDINVKFHCYLILTYIMLSENASKREKLNQGIYYELLKASFAEAQPVINYSLNLIVSAVCEKNKEVNTLVVCLKKIMMAESQNVATLHHICSFLIKYNTLFYPYKQFLIRNILGSLFPIAKNNNVPEYKITAIELACMIIKWELSDDIDNMQKLSFPLKRKIDDSQPTIESNNSSSLKKKSSEIIDNCLNFLAMVGCQTHDEKQESKISKLAVRSATLFKNILATEAIDTMEVKLKFGWIEKLLDNFLKKESLIKQNPNMYGNTNASLMNLLTTFDLISFMLNVLSPKLMLEAIKPLQDHLITFLQLAFNEVITLNNSQKDILINNRLNSSQIKQYNEGSVYVLSEILKMFPSNEGLEKLHVFIQMIITEGLNSNCSHKLEISLTLLKVSLLNFPNYMDNEILNTVGDVMFKFNENNKNPSIKVKCLEILKTHIDTMPRTGKQVFIEKVVMENLDKARNSDNNIPFEVQMKCFELVIIYIKDLSEATEGILLNTIFLEYIKTTTDERIMTVILNVITKWIEICRDESVFFNLKIIDVIKYITCLNRFPKLTEYCYSLNLEIYKNWYSTECIEFGLDCKSPSIRYEFINVYNSLWHVEGLCMRLYMIMSDEISYNLESSLAFYVQLLFLKLSKNTKLEGNFSFLNMNKLCDTNETMSNQLNLPVKSTYDMCSSLTQLCFIDMNLAKHMWTTVIPEIWSLFTVDQRKILSAKAVHFLTNNKLKNSFMVAFYESIILCKPKINFEPHQLTYIGKTYNLWYKVIEQLENVGSYFKHDKKNEALEGLIQMYSLLREEDVMECLFQRTIKCEYTKKALSFEQQGYLKIAADMYIEILENKMNDAHFIKFNYLDKDSEFIKIHLTKCLKELNEWDYLSEHILNEENFMLNIENEWKKSIENATCHTLKWYLVNKQNIWPSKLKWKYHFYLGMLGLKTLDKQDISVVQGHIELAIKEIIDEWRVLPKYICDAHLPLLQATQLIVEIQEALDIQKSWSQTPQDYINLHLLNQIWKNRNPWIGDNLSAWNDLFSWRQTFYAFLNFHEYQSKKYFINSAQDQLKLLFGEIALKQNMVDVCLKTLKSLDPHNATTSNWMYKMYLEAKCTQKIRKFNKEFNGDTESQINKDFNANKLPLLLIIKGSVEDYNDNKGIAFKHFSMGFDYQTCENSEITEWQCVIEKNFKKFREKSDKHFEKSLSESNYCLKVLNDNVITENAWIQWATLIQNIFDQLDVKDLNIALAAMKCYIIASKLSSNIKHTTVMANILWLLMFDDRNNKLLCCFEKCKFTFSNLWLPQILNILVGKDKSMNKYMNKIVPKIGKFYPQEMYLLLNRMYLNEKMKRKIEMELLLEDAKYNEDYFDENVEQTLKMEILLHDAKYNEDNVLLNGEIGDISETTEADDIPEIPEILENKKMVKIRQMMTLLQKCNLNIQLKYFVNQMISLNESWDEKLRRNLYECLYLCYDYAFEKLNTDVKVSSDILESVRSTIKSFVVVEDIDEVNKPFLVPDNLSIFYEFMMDKFLTDFNILNISNTKLLIKRLKIWIRYIEKRSSFPSKFVHERRCPKIHNIDWSVIRLPSINDMNDSPKVVWIHNFSGYVYLKDKSGTVVKQLTIRGTDGLLYTFSISSGHKIEAEERIFQLFRIVNDNLLRFKETAKRFLKISLPRTFSIAPDLYMIESKSSNFSLLEIYKETTKAKWLHDDIDYWFSVLNTCLITNKTLPPLKESFVSTQKKYCSGEILRNWVSLRYPLQADYWTFRKTFIEHYSVICLLGYVFNLSKLKPQMINIDENNGVVFVSHLNFFLNAVNENLGQNCSVPFRMTPNIKTFITPYRKHQIINCLTAIDRCLNDNFDDIKNVLKLLLKDELNIDYNTEDEKETMDNFQEPIKMVDRNLNYILKNFDNHDKISELLCKSFHNDLISRENPTWRPWL